MDIELSYDNGSPAGYKPFAPYGSGCRTYYGVRFTPAQANAKITGAKIYTSTQAGVGACTAMVYTGVDVGGYVLPDVRKDTVTFTPSSAGWVTVSFAVQPVIDSGDFIIFVTSGYNEHVAVAMDNSQNHTDRQLGSDNMTDDWTYMSNTGDFLVHAFVTYAGVEENADCGIKSFGLKAMPNPVLNRANIFYTLKDKSEMSLKIYDVSGKLVRTLAEGVYGTGVATWDRKDNDGKPASVGTYFCKLKAGNSVLTKVLTVI